MTWRSWEIFCSQSVATYLSTTPTFPLPSSAPRHEIIFSFFFLLFARFSSSCSFFCFLLGIVMQGGEGEREAPGEWEADGGGAGAGPSSLAVARGSAGRKGAGAAAAGGPRARPGAEASLQRQQQRRIIRWERFLPRRSLRVLLVEQDDSTRHIVTALLRKCSYHVAAVVDGLKAWDVLKEKNYTFDLVLCEVEVPSLSGISLLCKIMANELSRNIPVIMMSSHDSVSVVFRCMQKGAVDFLVKPVRKNELRNLWQHVWRRHCSTSFTNGPENMPNNQTVSESMSDNNAASNDVSANAGKGSKSGESCDGGDDQCSGSKPLMQNESLKKQVAALPVDDRNSARVMKSQSQQLGDDVATLANAPKNHDNEKAKDTSVGIEVTLSVQETAMSDKVQEQLHFYDKSLCTQQDLCYARGKECTDNYYRPFWQNVVPHKSPEGTIDFIGSVINGQCSLSAMDNDSERKAALCEVRRSSNTINTCNADSLPSWELSLTRPQLNGCVKNGLHEKNTLNHSAASAFSRYGYTGICLPDRKSGTSSATISVRTREHADKFQSQFNSHDTANEKPSPFVPDGRLESPQRNKEEAVEYQVIPSSNDENAEHLALVPTSEDICIGYSVPRNSAAFPHSQLGMMPLPIPVGAMPFQSFCSGYGPILQPMFYHEPTISPAAIEQAKCLTSSNQPADHGNHVNADIQSTAFHSCEEDHHPCPLELRRKSSTADVEQSDPRRPRLHICGTEEHTDQGGSYNRDIINGGGSNGNIGTADTAVNMRLAFEHGDESGLQNYRGKGVDPHCSHREAALIKFRLKRKDRCFEKKVRYHSRKMLAQQRPRVKGQFVRQAIIDSNTAATEVDD